LCGEEKKQVGRCSLVMLIRSHVKEIASCLTLFFHSLPFLPFPKTMERLIN
jgi:hypothetical protein